MISAHLNLNGSRDPNHASCRDSLPSALATINLPTKFEVSISTHYEDMKCDTKY